MVDWKNKIVRYAEEAPDQLLANPANFRLHPKNQQDALAGVLSDVGWIAPVIVNETTGHVIDGHLRVTLALRNDLPTIPVITVRLTEAEEKEALATFDPLSQLAGTDAAQLDALLREVSTGDENVQMMLDGLAQRAGVVPFEPMEPGDLWKGMPEFEHEDKTAFQSIVLHFKDQDAVDAFAALVEQPITPKTRYLWYPEIEIETYADKRYEPES